MRRSLIAASAAIIAAITGCSSDAAPLPAAPDPLVTVTASLEAPSVPVGDTIHAIAEVRDTDGKVLTNQSIAWSSSDTSIATVSGNGLVKGRRLGKAKIRARLKDAADSTELTVTPPATPPVVPPEPPPWSPPVSPADAPWPASPSELPP